MLRTWIEIPEDEMDTHETASATPLPSSPTQSAGDLHSECLLPTNTSSTIQTLFFDAVEAASPPLRQLASHSTPRAGSLSSAAASELPTSQLPAARVLPSSAFEEQRHPGKPGAAITRTTHDVEPGSHVAKSNSGGSTEAIESVRSGYVRTGSRSSRSGIGSSDAPLLKSQEGSINEGIPEKKQDEENNVEKKENERIVQEIDEEGKVYPRPLPLTLIIIGLCLSVFLISLDRTIITTVRIHLP